MKVEGVLEKEVELQHGLLVKDNEYKQFTVREVIGLDEEAISQPIYKKNPIAMYIELIHRCIVEVNQKGSPLTKNELKSLPVGMIDTLLYHIRLISIGPDYEVKDKCPKEECKAAFNGVYNLEDVEVIEGKRYKDVKLKRGILLEGKEKKLMNIKVCHPTGYVQEAIFKKQGGLTDTSGFARFGEMTTDAVLGCIVDANKLGIDIDVVKRMARIDRREITKSINNAPGLKSTIELEFPECGEVYDHPINWLDFLL